MSTTYQAGLRISEYVLEACVGQGTFGQVWRARHHVWGNDRVAIKLPTEPEFVRFLQREGLVVHGLRHPNVVRVLGLDPFADIPYLVMELVDGPALKQVLAEQPQGLDLDVAVRILRGILGGIRAAHEAGVVHRDLKPGNVLLNLAGKPLASLFVDDVKISDFGLGASSADTLRSLVLQSASLERDAQQTAIAGTLAYMAPEIRDGGGQATPQSDLYAVGVILHELLTGVRPAGAELPSALRPEMPPALDHVFRNLYVRLERRYPNATAALADLDARLRSMGGAPGSLAEHESAATGADASAHCAALHDHEQCPACDGAVGPLDQFCIHCGRQLVAQVRRCGTCGAYPGPDDRFCILCGATVAPVAV